MPRTSLSLPVPSCPVGRGKPLGSWCWDAPCGGAHCPMPGLCTGITEGVSGSAELRLHLGLFYLQQRDLGRGFPVNINIPKGLDSGRFLFFRGGTGTQAHTPPTRTAGCLEGIWRRLWALMGLLFYPLLWGVSRSWRLLLPCPAGEALTLGFPEHPEQRALWS